MPTILTHNMCSYKLENKKPVIDNFESAMYIKDIVSKEIDVDIIGCRFEFCLTFELNLAGNGNCFMQILSML